MLTRCPASKADVEEYFTSRHPTGEIVEVKLMNGFGFIEYKDSMDARDVVPGELSLMSPASPRTPLTVSQLSVRSRPADDAPRSNSPANPHSRRTRFQWQPPHRSVCTWQQAARSSISSGAPCAADSSHHLPHDPHRTPSRHLLAGMSQTHFVQC